MTELLLLEEDPALVLLARERLRRIVVGVLAVDVRGGRLEAEVERDLVPDLGPSIARAVDGVRTDGVRIGGGRTGAARPVEGGGPDVEHHAAVGDHLRVIDQPGRVDVDVHGAHRGGDGVEAERVGRGAAGVERGGVPGRIVLRFQRRDGNRLLAGPPLPGQVARIAVREVDGPGAGHLGHRRLGAGLVARRDVRSVRERDVVQRDEQAGEVNVPSVDEGRITIVHRGERVTGERQDLARSREQNPAIPRIRRLHEGGERCAAHPSVGRAARPAGARRAGIAARASYGE